MEMRGLDPDEVIAAVFGWTEHYSVARFGERCSRLHKQAVWQCGAVRIEQTGGMVPFGKQGLGGLKQRAAKAVDTGDRDAGPGRQYESRSTTQGALERIFQSDRGIGAVSVNVRGA